LVALDRIRHVCYTEVEVVTFRKAPCPRLRQPASWERREVAQSWATCGAKGRTGVRPMAVPPRREKGID